MSILKWSTIICTVDFNSFLSVDPEFHLIISCATLALEFGGNAGYRNPSFL